jgi:hypothetical protein
LSKNSIDCLSFLCVWSVLKKKTQIYFGLFCLFPFGHWHWRRSRPITTEHQTTTSPSLCVRLCRPEKRDHQLK